MAKAKTSEDAATVSAVVRDGFTYTDAEGVIHYAGEQVVIPEDMPEREDLIR